MRVENPSGGPKVNISVTQFWINASASPHAIAEVEQPQSRQSAAVPTKADDDPRIGWLDAWTHSHLDSGIEEFPGKDEMACAELDAILAVAGVSVACESDGEEIQA